MSGWEHYFSVPTSYEHEGGLYEKEKYFLCIWFYHCWSFSSFVDMEHFFKERKLVLEKNGEHLC